MAAVAMHVETPYRLVIEQYKELYDVDATHLIWKHVELSQKHYNCLSNPIVDKKKYFSFFGSGRF